MGLFSNNDELFELMSKSRERRHASQDTSGSSARGRSSASSRSSGSTPRKRTGSFGARRITQTEPEFYEVDGDALIVVEDGWSLGGSDEDEGEELQGSTLAIRSDTAIVGVCLAVGLVVGAFLMGRTNGSPQNTQANAPAVTIPSAVIGGAPTAVPASQRRVVPSAVIGAFTPGSASAPKAGMPAQPAPTPKAAEPAATARSAAEGKYILVVCTTTPGNARKVAKWLNEQARSPIFGRADLEAYTTRKGVVRIRGFKLCDKGVLRQVKATNDPLGGRGTFHTAYYKRA